MCVRKKRAREPGSLAAVAITCHEASETGERSDEMVDEFGGWSPKYGIFLAQHEKASSLPGS